MEAHEREAARLEATSAAKLFSLESAQEEERRALREEASRIKEDAERKRALFRGEIEALRESKAAEAVTSVEAVQEAMASLHEQQHVERTALLAQATDTAVLRLRASLLARWSHRA